MPGDSLTHVGGGNIAVAPETNQTRQPCFEVTVDLTEAQAKPFRNGMTAQARFRAGAHSIATMAVRRLIGFAESLQRH